MCPDAKEIWVSWCLRIFVFNGQRAVSFLLWRCSQGKLARLQLPHPSLCEGKLWYRDGHTPSCHGNGTTLLNDGGCCGPSTDCFRVKHFLWFAFTENSRLWLCIHFTSSENLSCPASVSVHHVQNQYGAHWRCWKSADHNRWYWGRVLLDSNYFLLWSCKLMRTEKEIRIMSHSL